MLLTRYVWDQYNDQPINKSIKLATNQSNQQATDHQPIKLTMKRPTNQNSQTVNLSTNESLHVNTPHTVSDADCSCNVKASSAALCVIRGSWLPRCCLCQRGDTAGYCVHRTLEQFFHHHSLLSWKGNILQTSTLTRLCLIWFSHERRYSETFQSCSNALVSITNNLCVPCTNCLSCFKVIRCHLDLYLVSISVTLSNNLSLVSLSRGVQYV